MQSENLILGCVSSNKSYFSKSECMVAKGPQSITGLIFHYTCAESSNTNVSLEFPVFQEHVWTPLCNSKYRLPHSYLCPGSMFGTSSISTPFWMSSFSRCWTARFLSSLLFSTPTTFFCNPPPQKKRSSFCLTGIRQQFVVSTAWDHTCYKFNDQVLKHTLTWEYIHISPPQHVKSNPQGLTNWTQCFLSLSVHMQLLYFVWLNWLNWGCVHFDWYTDDLISPVLDTWGAYVHSNTLVQRVEEWTVLWLIC